MSANEPPGEAENSSPPPPRGAWQPFTPRGVAAFAEAGVGRVLLVQLLVALLAGGVVLWFLNSAWLPVITRAVRALPETGEISGRRLVSPYDSAAPLAENRFLAIALESTARPTLTADLQVRIQSRRVLVCSLFGCLVFDYADHWTFALNRPAAEPKWGAWAPILLGEAVIGTILGLFVVWTALATVFSLPIWIAALSARRQVTFGGSWKLAGAALMPGTLLLLLGILLYGLVWIDLVGLLVCIVLHVVLDCTYLAWATAVLPAATPPVRIENPFSSAPAPALDKENPAN